MKIMQLNRLKYIFILPVCLFSMAALAGNKAEKAEDGILLFENKELLHPVFDKLRELETGKRDKINIVHIGDSHIQADFFTKAIRQQLQQRFGNGGYGFSFPYSLAKTNGTKLIKYTSNVPWESLRNCDARNNTGTEIGLSGILLSTNSSDFFIEINTDDSYNFNTIKILYQTDTPPFDLSKDWEAIGTMPKPEPSGGALHKIRKGETLNRIALKYNVSVAAIKKENNMRSDLIREGKMLRIPQKGASRATRQNFRIVRNDSLKLTNEPYSITYYNDTPLNRMCILPNKGLSTYNLNGVVLENDRKGLIYHSIGVNGAKASDYNKNQGFYNQLSVLQPDLIIISLGTNESFGRYSTYDFMSDINRLIINIQRKNRGVPVMIMTPPPSLKRRRNLNNEAKAFSEAIVKQKEYPTWDLYARLGGITAPQRRDNSIQIAKDKVHYTQEGYAMQGSMFSDDFLEAYENYIKSK